MYTPARSDLLALALATVMTAGLVAAMQSPLITLALAAFAAIPATPLLASWMSGPRHSLSSRFFFRGVTAIAAMAAAFIAGAVIQTPPDHPTADDLAVANVIIAFMLATISLFLLLAAETIVRSRAARQNRTA